MSNVQDALFDICQAITQLVSKRDQRRDAFAKGVKLAMKARLGQNADEVRKVLGKHGISSRFVEQAIRSSYSVFAICGLTHADCRALRE